MFAKLLIKINFWLLVLRLEPRKPGYPGKTTLLMKENAKKCTTFRANFAARFCRNVILRRSENTRIAEKQVQKCTGYKLLRIVTYFISKCGFDVYNSAVRKVVTL